MSAAYDADTGKLVWRFHVVPGDPAKPQENAALTQGAEDLGHDRASTSSGRSAAAARRGIRSPTIRSSISSISAPATAIRGTANCARRRAATISILSSVVALHAKTGEYAWHYQTTPGDTWDFDSTADVVLADLKIGGKMRHVLMHAPKNGFFYVIDRATGKLISAQKFATVTWADHIDLKTGRPIENPDARYTNKMAVVFPAETGAHNWQPMTFNPRDRARLHPGDGWRGASSSARRNSTITTAPGISASISRRCRRSCST